MKKAIQYTRKLEDAGLSRQLAETHLEIMGDYFESDFVTKPYLDQALLGLENRLDKKIQIQGAELSEKISAQGKELGEKITAQSELLSEKVEVQGKELGERITAQGREIVSLDRKIDDLGHRLGGRIDRLETKIDTRLTSMENRMVIKLGLIVVAVAGSLGTFFKFLA